jgi:hypothetical protein
MKPLAAMVVLIGLCFLIQPYYVLGNTFCQGFLTSGSRMELAACIQDLDRQAEIVEHERGDELAGISMSNVDLTKSLKDLQHSVHDIEQKTGNVDLDALDIKLLHKGADNLRDRVKELENLVQSQAILLDTQHQQIESLQKQIDTIRAGLVPKPRDNVKKATAPQKRCSAE